MFDEIENLQEPLAELTWYHLQTLMDKISDKTDYLWYANKALENGWSRNILQHQIEMKLYERQALPGKAQLRVTEHSQIMDILKIKLSPIVIQPISY